MFIRGSRTTTKETKGKVRYKQQYYINFNKNSFNKKPYFTIYGIIILNHINDSHLISDFKFYSRIIHGK